MSKKIVLKAELNCDKCKQKVMKTVGGIEGVESVQVDIKEQKVTVIGDVDPVCIIKKLRKIGWSDLVSVGPAKEPEKKPPPEKKENPKEEKKDQAPKPNPGPNITHVYLPRHCQPWCGGYCEPWGCGYYHY